MLTDSLQQNEHDDRETDLDMEVQQKKAVRPRCLSKVSTPN